MDQYENQGVEVDEENGLTTEIVEENPKNLEAYLRNTGMCLSFRLELLEGAIPSGAPHQHTTYGGQTEPLAFASNFTQPKGNDEPPVSSFLLYSPFPF
jgi:hypothetical protein